jgi:hypothetical protein
VWNSVASKPAPVRLADIQQQQQHEELVKPKPEPVKSVPVSTGIVQPGSMSIQLKSLLGVRSADEAKTKSVWSTPSPTEGPSASSLQDIMNEEISRKQTADPVVSVAPAKVSSSISVSNSWAARAMSGAPVTIISRQEVSNPKPSPMVDSSVNVTPVDNAKTSSVSKSEGKLMPRELSDWCSAQLIKIKGNDDAMELMEFCMSLKSAVDIRSYFSSNLGSSPQVTNFATEFIKLKEGTKKQVTQEKFVDNKFQTVLSKKKKPVGK